MREKEENSIYKIIGKNVRTLRTLRNEEISEIAALLNIEEFDYVLLEQGEMEVSTEHLRVLATRFDVTIDQLVGLQSLDATHEGEQVYKGMEHRDLYILLIKMYEDEISMLREQVRFLRSRIDKSN